MLYLAIPAHNEAATIGVLLWRLRTVLAEFPREYEAVVYDDASSDSTSEILESYARVMPLTVLRGERRVGYAGAVDALVRHVARDTRYPRRDAMLLLQGDFTDSPSLVPEFVKRFEGGTDLVAGERGRSVRRKAPTPVKRLLQVEPWLTRFLVRAEGVRDLTSSYRLIRISVLRDLLRTVGDAPVCAGDPRTANADFLMRLIPLARRVEALPVEPTWEIRLRETRVVAVPDAMSMLRWAWRSRGQRAVPSTAPETSDAPRQLRPAREGRGDLRLESRGDVLADAAVVTESSRGRKPRGSRTDQRTESRTPEGRPDGRGGESRNDSRPTRPARGESRRDAKAEPGLEARAERTVPRLEAPSADSTVNTDSEATLAPRERPPRRKRTRGRRERTELAGAAESPEALGDDAESAESREPVIPNRTHPANANSNADLANAKPASANSDTDAGVMQPVGEASDFDFPTERELSPALSEAVADAELELDANARTRPPRKKRRRRGSRGGRGASNAAGADDGAEEGSSDSADSGEASGDDSSDGADGGSSDMSAEFAGESGEGRDSASEGDGEGDRASRARRRGRRGRRGGARRSRGARGEGENASGGEDFSAPPPPPPAPEL